MTFAVFAQQVASNITNLNKHELFVVGASNRFLEDVYLSAFPEGTDPIYKTNSTHNCTCCKQFIRGFGNVVAIVDGEIRTIWDNLDVPYPYNIVANTMAKWVREQPITGVFRTIEPSFGKRQTFQTDGDDVLTWNHFYGAVDKRYRSTSPDADRGTYFEQVSMLKRALTELTGDAIATVLDLASNGGIYRCAEHQPALVSFRDLSNAYARLSNDRERERFLWTRGGQGICRFRNTVIGTLVQDLSDGVELEKAVRSFEAKVAPQNYKRTTALVTPKMVEAAIAEIKALGLESAQERRHARLSDITVSNVLWVSADNKEKMRSSLENILYDAVKKPPKNVVATDIGIDTFMQDVLPTAEGIKVLVRNSQKGNFVSLTAPAVQDSELLFKWNNAFGWSYNGDVTDSLKERVKKAGGNVTSAALRVSLGWFNYDDLDLHCNRSNGETIYFMNKQNILDVDMNAGCGHSREPVENMSFTNEKLQDGVYKFVVHQYSRRETDNVGFEIEIEYDGKVTQYSYPHAVTGKIPAVTITVKDGKVVDVGSKLTSTMVSQEMWGVQTETFIDVQTLMLSPNYWDDQQIGNKHYIFALKGCKNPDPVRGIYNEFLRSDLEKHRKVFDLIGKRTSCPYADEQISGVGFSSTRADMVTVQVVSKTGTRNFNITF